MAKGWEWIDQLPPSPLRALFVAIAEHLFLLDAVVDAARKVITCHQRDDVIGLMKAVEELAGLMTELDKMEGRA